MPERGPTVGPLLVVGLGNPEPRYQGNRHNLGFRVVDALGVRAGARWSERFRSQLGQGSLGDARLFLLKPLTFMNASGEAVAAAAKFYKIPPEAILVAHDELDLPLSRIQLRIDGGHGGHNGLRSIEGLLGSRAFGRLRLGIGRPPVGWDAANYVLSDFETSERAEVDREVEAATAAAEAAVVDGMQAAMNRFNRRA